MIPIDRENLKGRTRARSASGLVRPRRIINSTASETWLLEQREQGTLQKFIKYREDNVLIMPGGSVLIPSVLLEQLFSHHWVLESSVGRPAHFLNSFGPVSRSVLGSNFSIHEVLALAPFPVTIQRGRKIIGNATTDNTLSHLLADRKLLSPELITEAAAAAKFSDQSSNETRD